MGKPELTLNLEEKALLINGQRLQLDKSLYSARVSRVTNRDGMYTLSLYYRNDENIGPEEGDKIAKLLEEQSLLDKYDENKIQVYSKAFSENSDEPDVTLAGYIKLRVKA